MIHPARAFTDWFAGLTPGQRIELALSLARAVPAADGSEADLPAVPEQHVTEYLNAPHSHPQELIARLGVLKALVDAMCVPLVRRNLQAHGQAQLALMRVQALAAGNPVGAQLAANAARQGASFVDDHAAMYTSWDDLAHRDGGALTPVALYEWLYLTTRGLSPDKSPFIGQRDLDGRTGEAP